MPAGASHQREGLPGAAVAAKVAACSKGIRTSVDLRELAARHYRRQLERCGCALTGTESGSMGEEALGVERLAPLEHEIHGAAEFCRDDRQALAFAMLGHQALA